MERTILYSVLLSLVVFSHCFTLQYPLPGGPLSEIPGLQVDSQGRTFVAAGNQLYRLNRDLILQETVNLSSPAVDISLNSGGEWLVVCTRISCTVYNTSDLNSVIATTGIELGVRDRVAVFTAGDTYYVGNMTILAGREGEILLRQYEYERSDSLRSREFQTDSDFDRIVYGGFLSGDYSYFVVLDRSPRSLRIMRVCHVTSCIGSCSFNALYEEDFSCGSTISSNADDRICGVSVVDEFASSSGASIILSRCRPRSRSNNRVCVIKVADIDRTMERRYNECLAGRGDINPAWGRTIRPCGGSNFQPRGFCDLNLPSTTALDDRDVNPTPDSTLDILPPVNVPTIVDIGAQGQENIITASVPLKVDSFSLMVIAYTISGVGNFVGKFVITSTMTTLTLTNVFDVQQLTSQVDMLQWQEGLDYVLAATTSEVLRVPVEVCSTNTNCSSCITEDNPLCGWCVVENKCSRQSQCRDGNSTSSTRWIPSSGPSANTNTQCIMNTISPNQFVLDNQQILNVTVGGPGLPANLDNETYMCHFEDSRGRFNITVPAMEVDPLTQYTCDITDQTFMYDGVQAVMHFSFMSSLVNVPFDRTDNAMTIYRCNATNSCSECVETRNACGWCVINKLCRGTAQDCTNTSNFLQLEDTAASFQEVCPLLDLENGTTNYTQHVRAQPKLHLTTKNLPNIVPGYSYMCLIRNTMFNATRNNETSLTCQVGTVALSLTSDGGMELIDIGIIWKGPAVNHRIDTINAASLTLYDCRVLATDCSSCIASRGTPGFECGWCDHPSSNCSISEECSNPFIVIGEQCPAPVITGFSPSSGPPNGRTILTIRGRDLGVVFDNFLEAGSNITVGGVICTPLNMDYTSGMQVLCQTGSGMGEGAQRVEVNLVRDAGIRTGRRDGFMVVLPTVSSVEPAFGPIAGGTRLTINGTGLDIGTSTRITLDEARGLECRDIVRTSTQITCTSTNTSSPSSSPTPLVVVHIDAQNITKTNVSFQYRNNPNFTSIQPKNSILSGGLTIYFIGNDLDVSQNPQLTVGGTPVNCSNVNNTHLSCITPPLSLQNTVMYLLRLDNAPPPDPTVPSLQLSVMPDPSGLMLVTRSVPRGSNSTIVQINGQNLGPVDASEIGVSIAEQDCKIRTVTDTQILCVAPADPGEGVDSAMVVVMIGQNLNFPLPDQLLYDSPAINNPIPTNVIVPAVVVPVVVVFLCCLFFIVCIVCVARRQGKKKELQYTNLITRMELLEYEMADECKRAFTELQTDLADLVQISSDKNLPYRDFRTFAMRFLFPKSGDDHPVLLPLKVEGVKMEEEKVLKQLDSFRELIMDKRFLLVFVHTLESQNSFSLQDKCTVASLLMVAFQNDLDYATDVLQTLLAEMMRKAIAKSHPKLLLRRTESVAEKMLANWLAFLLYPYILEHVGEPLFILYRAIKSQLEKGPVDIISGEAKNSLSEEKLLRQPMEVKPVEGIVQHEDEEVPIKMWDCDSITQAKEKILDALYRNTPVSKRPQLTNVDLEFIGKGANGVTLRDQDATNAKDGEWTKINTLGHYHLEEMSKVHSENPKLPVPKFRLIHRPDRPLSGVSFDTLGTIISNISAANRSSMVMSASELNRIYHLVKPEPEDGEGTATKIMSEVFLTRLLSTKRILQSYVDKLFESIFAIPHGKALPKAIKSMFDFLDLQASELGITDSEILHTWKTNSLPLRFWVNLIKNPDFVFDINKSATVDSCLTVIAQAYIDATSTADIKYTKDTPSTRLLYANEVKKYKTEVENYYSAIQTLPKLSSHDMTEYLRDTAQVCANSVKQYDPTVVNDPASMKRRLYFVTESALFELFKFASDYSDDIIDALNEEGLAITAASFDQIRKAFPAQLEKNGQ